MLIWQFKSKKVPGLGNTVSVHADEIVHLACAQLAMDSHETLKRSG